jgi:energy-coupling factor transporter ATP-binding protein EcfA2
MLFQAPPASPRAVLVRALLLVAALAFGATDASAATLGALTAAGVVAMLVDRGRLPTAARVGFGLASSLLPALLVLGLTGSPRAAWTTLLHLLAGLVWVTWFGGVVSWPALRSAARAVGLSEGAIDLAEETVAHGVLLLRELRRRDEAVAVRLGAARRRDRFADTGPILAGAVERAFDRAVTLEEARRLRAGEGVGSEPAGVEALALVGVTAAYDDGAPRLHAVSLTLDRGRWLAVAGPSGSGKSTLLRLAAGLMSPKSGSIRRLGIDPASKRSRLDPRVGLVFQDPDDQLLGATPLEDLAWGLRRRGLSEPEAAARARAQLALLGVEHLAGRPVHTLSFGERKRIAFAAVLVCEPELMLCDEPTIGLDPVAARRLVSAVERVASARGIAVVWVTHDLDALPAPVDRLVLLRDGQVVFDGPRVEALRGERLAAAGLAEGDRALPR